MVDRDQLALDLDTINPGLADTLRATSGDWWSRAWRAVLYLASTGQPFQAYDLVSVCGIEEPDNTGTQWGALFMALHRAGHIEYAGGAPSKRPTANGSMCRQWIGRPAAANCGEATVDQQTEGSRPDGCRPGEPVEAVA
ncbi:hypothetical protein [Nocardiopsis sp. LOL_012]|uniref:hypothetical protein n=1 Tax=Nocardiopsis sp. LOL_012 TaxID=3345409 RepID=UPI003A87CE13